MEKTILNWSWAAAGEDLLLVSSSRGRYSSQGCCEDILGSLKTFLHLKPGRYPSKAPFIKCSVPRRGRTKSHMEWEILKGRGEENYNSSSF